MKFRIDTYFRKIDFINGSCDFFKITPLKRMYESVSIFAVSMQISPKYITNYAHKPEIINYYLNIKQLDKKRFTYKHFFKNNNWKTPR